MKKQVMSMKNLAIIIWMGCMTLPAVAQRQEAAGMPRQSVFVEVGGPSNGLGLNYECRLKGAPQWGWRAGLAWGYASESIRDIKYNSSERSYTLPVGVNFLSGHRRSKLELGAGASLGIYNTHARFYEYGGKSNSFGYFLYANVGYRYQSRSGFLFRAGWSPITGFGTEHGVDSDAAIFYLSLGWAF